MQPAPTTEKFEEMLSVYRAEIYRYALRLTGSASDADDLFQETFFKAFKAYRRLPDDANVRAWLYRIATNTFLSERRKLQRQQPLADLMLDSLAAPPVDHDRAVDAGTLLKDVERFVATLPEKQRVALVLRKYHELGYDEIARTLNCSESAARANVYEALQKLRNCFADRLGAVQ